MANGVAVIGDAQSIAGFHALGADCYGVETEQQTLQALETAIKEECALLCMTEAAAEQIWQRWQDLQNQEGPICLLIPGETGNTGQAERQMADVIQRAVGTDVWEKEE